MQASLLRAKIARLKQELSEGNPEQGKEVLQQTVAEALEGVTETEEEYRKLSKSRSPVSNVFFDDIRGNYHDSLLKLSTQGVYEPYLRTVSADLFGSLDSIATAIIGSILHNINAYETAVNTARLTFTLKLRTDPAGAKIFYRRKPDDFQSFSDVTNSNIENLPIAVWYVKFHKDGFKEEEITYDATIQKYSRFYETHKSSEEAHTITLKQYVSAYGRPRGWASLVPIFVASLYSRVAPGWILDPPLGNVIYPAMLATLAFLLVAAGIVFLIFHRSRKYAIYGMTVCVLGLLGSFLAYVVYNQRYVRIVPIPSLGTAKAVCVGDERTDYAKKLGNIDDYELLRYRGPYEEEVDRLWTPGSLAKAKVSLWLSYTGAAFFWVCFISVPTYHAPEQPFHPAGSATH